MKLLIGSSDFKTFIDTHSVFVDKSLLIKEILDSSAEVILITRPRRFGKTLNMSMLRYFFAEKVNDQPTQGMFKGLKIDGYPQYMEHQGKYPVIYLSFKDLKAHSFKELSQLFDKLISELYGEHRYLLYAIDESTRLYEDEKLVFNSILEKKATFSDISASLKNLTQYLYRYHKQKPLVIIDEYDTPIQAGYINQFYDQAIHLLRTFLSSALKDNITLFKAVLTGILRISRESLFSGLNNLKVYSILNPKFSDKFGFTEEEVSQLLTNARLQDQKNAIKDWYNGYQIGKEVIYNPWSIMNCIDENGLLKSYWVNTSDDALLKNLLLKSNMNFKKNFEILLNGETILCVINENFVFVDLNNNHESAIWNFLLMTGYLKLVTFQETDQGSLCNLSIPNREIRNQYRSIVERWLSNGYGIEWYTVFLNNLLNGDMENFAKDLQHIFLQTISYQDVAKNPECFYHGFIIGLTASLYNHPNYFTRSNRESGLGRYDFLIQSRDSHKLTILFEFKNVIVPDKGKAREKSILEKEALRALKQIDKKQYLSELIQQGIKNIMKVSIAFSTKNFSLKHEKISL